ncbi:MAG: hypothetical protein ACP5VS_14975, partial [Desulfomonilaceae bacterium]
MSPLIVFAFQPQSDQNYVDGLVTQVRQGKLAPKTSAIVIQAHAPAHNRLSPVHKSLPLKRPRPIATTGGASCLITQPRVKAKAMFCVDKSTNRVILAENELAPLPIASITKLLTAMVAIDQMDLNAVVETPSDIKQVEKHVVGIRP